MTEEERRYRIKERIGEYLRNNEITDPWREKKGKRNLYRVKKQEVGGGYFEKRRSSKRRER